jgi:hypothetical protein
LISLKRGRADLRQEAAKAEKARNWSMSFDRVLRWALVSIAIAGLAAGIVCYAADRSDLADLGWTLEAGHEVQAKRLRSFARAVDSILADQEFLRKSSI